MAYLDRYLDEARRQQQGAPAMDPGTIARMDQTMARNDEVNRQVAQVTDGLDIVPQRDQLRIQALMIAIGHAAQRIRPKPCPHMRFDIPPFHQDIRINLSPLAAAACEACFLRLLDEHYAEHGHRPVNTDDDRCDLCDAPADRFHEINVQWGVALVSMNVCGECLTWMQPVPVQRFPQH